MAPTSSNGPRERLAARPSAHVDGWAALPPEYAIPAIAPSLDEARAYCERLARSHYENFSVATWFLPERLRRHFYSVYAYCRISDDLGDEVGNAEQSLRLLDQWEGELNATYASLGCHPERASASEATGGERETGNASGERRSATDVPSEGRGFSRSEESPSEGRGFSRSEESPSEGRGFSRAAPSTEKHGALAPEVANTGERETGNVNASPRHPVFIALRETIRECDIPRQPFADLLQAFRQDQTVVRYKTFNDLLAYCRYSANPVGRLVLNLCGYKDRERQQLSDFTCTALQLANFWQDVAVDFDKGRVYLPLEDMRRFGVTEDDIAARRVTPQFLELMAFQVARARQWFAQGLPLAQKVDRELAIDIELFTRGGQEILNCIERRNYDVLTSRPAISKPRKFWLVAVAALRSKLP